MFNVLYGGQMQAGIGVNAAEVRSRGEVAHPIQCRSAIAESESPGKWFQRVRAVQVWGHHYEVQIQNLIRSRTRPPKLDAFGCQLSAMLIINFSEP